MRVSRMMSRLKIEYGVLIWRLEAIVVLGGDMDDEFSSYFAVSHAKEGGELDSPFDFLNGNDLAHELPEGVFTLGYDVVDGFVSDDYDALLLFLVLVDFCYERGKDHSL